MQFNLVTNIFSGTLLNKVESYYLVLTRGALISETLTNIFSGTFLSKVESYYLVV